MIWNYGGNAYLTCKSSSVSWKFASAMVIRQPTLASKPRGDATRNPKQGTSGPEIGQSVQQKHFKKVLIYVFFLF